MTTQVAPTTTANESVEPPRHSDSRDSLGACSEASSIYECPPVYAISTSTAYNVEQRVRIVLAQFPGYEDYPVVKVPHIKTTQQVQSVVRRAASHGSLVVHTLIRQDLRDEVAAAAQEHGVKNIDLTGELLAGMANFLGQEPLQEPGLYWAMHRDEFDRITAIEYTLAHDDGRRPEEWPLADIVLVGPSRSGKTPLSVYLGVMGYKVANIPLVVGVPPHLERVPKGRVVGLVIDPETLQAHRSTRRIGVSGTAYTDPDAIHDEVTEALRLYRRQGYHIVSIKDRAVEACAEEVVHRVTMHSNLPRRSSAHAIAQMAAAAAAKEDGGGGGHEGGFGGGGS